MLSSLRPIKQLKTSLFSPPKKKAVVLLYLDNDGFILEPAKLTGPNEKTLLENDACLQVLANYIKTIGKEFTVNQVVFTTGASNQQQATDLINTKGQCETLERLCEKFSKIDDMPPCTVDASTPSYLDVMHLLDESKLGIVYAKMHEFALQQYKKDPETVIFFPFIYNGNLIEIDLNNDGPPPCAEQILIDLDRHFTRHPDWLPPNVNLSFHHYNGDTLSPITKNQSGTIRGQGIIDENFLENIFTLAQALGLEFKRNKMRTDSMHLLNLLEKQNKILEDFKKERFWFKQIMQLIQEIEMYARIHKTNPDPEIKQFIFFADQIKKILSAAVENLMQQEAAPKDVQQHPVFSRTQGVVSLMENLRAASPSTKQKQDHLKNFRADLNMDSLGTNIAKNLAAVFASAIVLVSLAALIAFIGAYLWWSLPFLAIFLTAGGLLEGSFTFASIAYTTACILPSIATYAWSRLLLFKTDAYTQNALELVETGNELITKKPFLA